VTNVSALGWGSEHPFLRDNRYDNPFWNEASLMRTNKGHMLRANVFWLTAGEGERAQWFGADGSLVMGDSGYHGDIWHQRMHRSKPARLPDYFNSDMLPEKMRHRSHHGDSATFISAEFINAIVEDRNPEIDLYHSLAMTVPGIVAHRSALQGGAQLEVPQYDRTPPAAPKSAAAKTSAG
jgi:hypothetical protein